jgi:hypothetical protein
LIIKTIHLMNFTNADTLAPIVKMRCSETDKERGELCAFFIRPDPREPGNLAPKIPARKPPAGSKKAAGRCWQPGILCDSDSLN